jgi:selenide,water dikinase
VLVSAETGDDAAVVALPGPAGTAGRGPFALVQTVDFFTPIVDDAFDWGRIAAANALSDVYAMGGRPVLAVNLLGWPRDVLPTELAAEVLRGGLAVATEAGCHLAGGHSVDDPEPKYGLAVVGEVHPDRVLTNTGLRDGDALVLTKPLGVGITTTAIKAGTAPDDLVAAAVASMTASNAAAARAAVAAGATGCTDVTGFGLLGHLLKMAAASGVDAVLDVAAVPVLSGVRALAESGCLPGGSRRNRDWVAPSVDAGRYGEIDVLLLADAQTSGGLLFGAEPERARVAVAELAAGGVSAAVIGTVRTGTGRITLR